MPRRLSSIVFLLLTVLVIATAGCNSKGNPGPAASPATDGSAKEKMKAELAKLSPEDAASAEKQHVCPVTSDMLGTMGPPIKVDVDGQAVWICCDGCRKKLLADKDTYLAKLKKEGER